MKSMPVIDVRLYRLNKLLGQEFTLKELEEILFRFGMELDSVKETDNDYQLKIEITPDRPDMLSVWGLARALRKYLGIDKGMDRYNIRKGNFHIYVDESVSEIRPYIAATVVKNIKLTEEDLEDLIYAQEKLHETFCRGRKKASIGFYPLRKLNWPLYYKADYPERIKFKPLGFETEMNAIEILEKHPTGQQYAHLLRGAKLFPIFIDSSNNVLSLPPIINSEDHGKVSIDDSEILLEVTGTHKPTVKLVVNIITAILNDMGGDLYSVSIHYKDGSEISPYMNPRKWRVDKKYIEKILGMKFDDEKIKILLQKMGLESIFSEDNKLEVMVPAYRADIWHQIDIIDDIARAYGFDNFDPELTPVFTIGGMLDRTKVIDYVRELLIGLGYTEVFTYALTSKEDQFARMRLDISNKVVEIMGAKEEKINIVRNWLLPELLKTLAYNKERRYPIKIYEVSDIVELDNASDTGAVNRTRIAALSAHKEASFTEIRGVAEYLLRALGIDNYKIKRITHNSFIEGRVAGVFIDEIQIGVIGELHPETILNWGLSVPICAMELDLDALMHWSYSPVNIA